MSILGLVAKTALTLVLLFWFLLPAQAAKKALLIGINEYSHLEDLKKSVGDAEAIGAALKGIGFEITIERNLDRQAFNLALVKFKKSLVAGDVALFHFSGHGITNGTDNLLLPADMRSGDEMTPEIVALDAISIRTVDDMLSSVGTETRILIVDACRNNPFERQGLKSIGLDRGLSATEPKSGTFIMYAAGTRERALDRLGDNDTEKTSVYTRVLLKHLTIPGKAIDDIAQDVRTEVASLAKSIKHRQSPAYYDELPGRYFLVPKTNKSKIENEGGKEGVEPDGLQPQPVPPPLESPKPDTEAGLKLCNGTESRVGIAVNYRIPDGWQSEGWWLAEPKNCVKILLGQLNSRYYYIYAVDYDKGGSWGGKAKACIKDKSFTIKGLADCEKRGYQTAGFFEVDTGNEQFWTVSLSGEKTSQ